MKSPFDSSELVPVRPGVHRDSAGGYLIDDIGKIRTQFEGKIQQLNTREMKLDTLGIFPLANDALPLMERSLKFDGKDLVINALFVKSQIPIYGDSKSTCAYIPFEGANICRYFHDLWRLDAGPDQHDENDAVLAGFAILASYAGL